MMWHHLKGPSINAFGVTFPPTHNPLLHPQHSAQNVVFIYIKESRSSILSALLCFVHFLPLRQFFKDPYTSDVCWCFHLFVVFMFRAMLVALLVAVSDQLALPLLLFRLNYPIKTKQFPICLRSVLCSSKSMELNRGQRFVKLKNINCDWKTKILNCTLEILT